MIVDLIFFIMIFCQFFEECLAMDNNLRMHFFLLFSCKVFFFKSSFVVLSILCQFKKALSLF